MATVKAHVSHILAKLGLDPRTQLARWVPGHGPRPPAPARRYRPARVSRPVQSRRHRIIPRIGQLADGTAIRRRAGSAQ